MVNSGYGIVNSGYGMVNSGYGMVNSKNTVIAKFRLRYKVNEHYKGHEHLLSYSDYEYLLRCREHEYLIRCCLMQGTVRSEISSLYE